MRDRGSSGRGSCKRLGRIGGQLRLRDGHQQLDVVSKA